MLGKKLPALDHCHWRITAHPALLLTVSKVLTVGPCECRITNGMPSPEKPCAWVVELHRDDTYEINYDSNITGCDEPEVVCLSGDCS